MPLNQKLKINFLRWKLPEFYELIKRVNFVKETLRVLIKKKKTTSVFVILNNYKHQTNGLR